MQNKLIHDFLNEDTHEKQGSCEDPRPNYTTGYQIYNDRIWFTTKYAMIASDPKHDTKITKYFEPAKGIFPIEKLLRSGIFEISEKQLKVIDLEKKFFYFESNKYDTKWMKYFYNLNPKQAYKVKIDPRYPKCSPLQIIDPQEIVISMFLPYK